MLGDYKESAHSALRLSAFMAARMLCCTAYTLPRMAEVHTLDVVYAHLRINQTQSSVRLRSQITLRNRNTTALDVKDKGVLEIENAQIFRRAL